MRVLITNSLVLAAISLAPSASAAPYTTTATSSIDAYESYPNSTALAQESGPSSAPSTLCPYRRSFNLSRPTSPTDVRRDEIIHVQSLYDGSPFGNVFGPVANLFGTIGMNAISESIPLTEDQKTVLEQLHDALKDAAGSVLVHIPAGHPVSPLSSRSLEDRQIQNPLATLGSLPVLPGNTLAPLSDLLATVGIGKSPTTPLTDLQKEVIAKLQAAISNVVGDVTASVPKLAILPLGHQARSVEERSLGNIITAIDRVPFLSSALSPILSVINSIGVTDGTPLDDFQKQALSELHAAVSVVVEDIKAHASTVHIEHTREEHEHWDHHDHDPHRDDHRSHDEHKDRGKPWDEHKESGKSWDEHKDDTRPRDAHKDLDEPHDTHKDDQKLHGAHKDGHSDRCQEPRDGQSDDCKHHKDGKDRDEDSSLLKISLGHQHHP